MWVERVVHSTDYKVGFTEREVDTLCDLLGSSCAKDYLKLGLTKLQADILHEMYKILAKELDEK